MAGRRFRERDLAVLLTALATLAGPILAALMLLARLTLVALLLLARLVLPALLRILRIVLLLLRVALWILFVRHAAISSGVGPGHRIDNLQLLVQFLAPMERFSAKAWKNGRKTGLRRGPAAVDHPHASAAFGFAASQPAC